MFFKIESWNFQHLFENEFRETSQSFNTFSWFRQLLITFFSLGCMVELKFCEVSQNSFSNENESFSFLSWKTKNFISEKNNFLAIVNIKTKKLCLLIQFSRRFCYLVPFHSSCKLIIMLEKCGRPYLTVFHLTWMINMAI